MTEGLGETTAKLSEFHHILQQSYVVCAEAKQKMSL